MDYFFHIYSRLRALLRRHPSIVFGLIFCISWALFLVFQWSVQFPDPDSFYHAKMAQLLATRGIIRDFPWAHFTLLNDFYIDQHLLYHVFLVPFVIFLPPLVGLKIFTALFAALFVTVFCWVLRQLNVQFYAVWSALLLITVPFLFRISLAKAVSMALVFLFVGLYLFIRGRRGWLLAVWAAVYVWAYGGFFLLAGLGFMYALVHYIASRDFQKSWRPLLWTGIGTALGVVINPYFPKNIVYFWQQFVQIGVINYSAKIGVGGEWYPYGWFELMKGSLVLTTLVVACVVWFVWHLRRQRALSWAALLWMLFFLAFTLKSRRYVEYYVPFAVFFVAVMGDDIIRAVWRRWARGHFWRTFWHRAALVTGILYLSLVVPAVVVKDWQQNLRDTHNGIPLGKFSQSSRWLAANSEAGDIVFHSDWDEFPVLFYYNDKDYYIVGLDPTFMYNYNQDLYWKWARITLGEQADDLYGIIQGDFQARWVFMENDHTAMRKNIAATDGFVLVYQDDEVTIFKVE